MSDKVINYIEAIGRNEGEDKQHSHLYALTEKGDYWPMCIYGWNRSDGESFSILRGHAGRKGLCKICQKRKDKGLDPIYKGANRKTKWL